MKAVNPRRGAMEWGRMGVEVHHIPLLSAKVLVSSLRLDFSS